MAAEQSDSFELYLLERKKGKLRKALVAIVVFGCSAFVILGQLHSVELMSNTFPDVGAFVLVWSAIWLIHALTVGLFSLTRLWIVNNRARIFIGCMVSAVCAIALDFACLLAKELGPWCVGALRVLQELGFALVSLALPAVLCTEIPSSANVFVPLYNAARGASVLFGASVDSWLTQLDKAVPFSVVVAGLGATAALCYCLFDSSWDCYRRALPRAPTLRVNWDIVLVAFTSFTCLFNMVFVVVTLKHVTTAHHMEVAYGLILTVAAVLYLLATPFVGTFIRWLPPRGILYALALLITVFGLVLLEYFIMNPHLALLLFPVVFFSLGVGALPALMHMHLLDRIAQSIYGRHHVAAGRVVSVAASMGLLVASVTPDLLKVAANDSKSLMTCFFVPITLSSVTLLGVLVTMGVEVYRATRAGSRSA